MNTYSIIKSLTRRAFFGLGLAVALLTTGGALAAETTRTIPYKVVATTSQVADLVRNLAGDRAQVTGLLGEGVDPHTYKMTRSDMAQIMSADIVFYNGLLLEGRMTDALVRVATAGRPVHAVTELLDEAFLMDPEDYQSQYDPHVWMDVAAWMKAAEAVRDQLAKFDPAGAEAYRANAAAYLAQLATLDDYARRVLATIPEDRRVLVTAHDAFNYLGRAYGIEVRGIQGISTESEAGLRQIEELVDLLVTRQIGAVFVETSVSDRNVRALVDGAAARGHRVAIGGALFSDAMGPPGTYEGTYVGMIDHNVTTIARALGGNPPAGGLNDRLAALQP